MIKFPTLNTCSCEALLVWQGPLSRVFYDIISRNLNQIIVNDRLYLYTIKPVPEEHIDLLHHRSVVWFDGPTTQHELP